MLSLLFALLLAPRPTPVAAAAPLPAVVCDDKFDAARLKFARAAVSDSLDERKAAIDELVALGNPEAAGVLAQEYGNTAEGLRVAKQKDFDARYALERRQIVVDGLQAQLKDDPSVETLLSREKDKLKQLEKELASAQREMAKLAPWRDALVDGMTKLHGTLGSAGKRKAEQEVWTAAKEDPDVGLRMAAIELLGRVGGAGTASQLHDLLEESSGLIAKLQGRMAKAMVEVRKMEQRMQAEQAANGGRMTAGTAEQYERSKQEAVEVQTTIFRLDLLIEAAARAGGAALSRESGKDLERTMTKLLGALKKKDRVRVDTLQLLTLATSEEARVHVRALLATETEPAGLGTLIDGLAALGDESIVPDLLSKYVAHESWFVRARAASALAKLRSREAIPVLIERLGVEDGRLKTDLVKALRSLTGQKFHANVAIWQRWWQEHEKGFEVPPEEPPKSTVEEAKEASGVTFFGISTDSQRVLFILDLSGSMKFAMKPKNNPDDDPQKPYDYPGPGENSRLEAAKQDLVRAIRGLKDGGVFDLVMFASDVWSWSDTLVTMTSEAREQVIGEVGKLDAVGGTNIYGALERALDMCGAKGGGQWTKPPIDTIYLLTDGRATAGVTTDREQILAFVRERNATAGITIHTIGLSDAHDAVLLRRMAEENGGQYIGR